MANSSKAAVGANAGRARSHNRQVVLDRVRLSGQIGRAEIARASGLSTQAVSNIIAQLLDDGLIIEQGRRVAGRGLPAVQYALNPTGAFALGVEVRPDAVFGAIIDLCGNTVISRRLPLEEANRDSVTATVCELKYTVRKAARVPSSRLLGAGIVMPGPFGDTGLPGGEAELAIWGDSSPEEWLSEALSLPVTVENDANAAAISERVSGVAQGLDTYAFLYFGTGLGLGMVSRGQLVSGAFGNAGEIGHIPVKHKDEIVPLESVVSRLALQTHLASVGIEARDGDQLGALFKERNPYLMAWLDQAAEPLAAGLATIENLLDPEAVIVGGAMPDAILDYLVARVELPEFTVANRADRTTPRLLRGSSGRLTATLGAAALVINQAFTPKIAAQH